MSTNETEIDDKKALENLILDDGLGKLKALSSGFNIFESIGAVRRELRHSDFLAFLLNPSQNHGLNDVFVKDFLFDIAKDPRSPDFISPIDVDLYELSDLDVRREWKNIDILLISEKEKFVCVIENKIDSGERENQLTNYSKKIEDEFQMNEYKQLYIYLTIEGDSPEKDENENWLPYSYNKIYTILSSIIETSEGKIGEDIYILLKHYTEMINRHLMTNNEITELSRNIYKRHKRAFDLIFKHKPDIASEILEYIEKYIENHIKGSMLENIELDLCTKTYTRFAVKNWDSAKMQKSGEKWTKSKRLILFEFAKISDEIVLTLYIGPGENEFRTKIFNAISDNTQVGIFKGKSKNQSSSYTPIYKNIIVKKPLMEDDIDAIAEHINNKLDTFFKSDNDFEKLCQAMESILFGNNDPSPKL